MNDIPATITKRWKVVDFIDAGGQGRVFLVEDKYATKEEESILALQEILQGTRASVGQSQIWRENAEKLRAAIVNIITNSRAKRKALKLLHKPNEGRDGNPNIAIERMKREVSLLAGCRHVGIVPIIERFEDELAYVMEFYPSTLKQKRYHLKGKPYEALRVFKKLLDAVGHLHRKDIIHRDIKPSNIFIDGDDPIIGDFGIAFCRKDDNTRLSETFENVGSWDFMPVWAMNKRIEDVPATFDIDSLGRVLWWMVSGQDRLQQWYFEHPHYPELNVEIAFQDEPGIELINPILKECIFEHEFQAKTDIGKLADLVDIALSTESNGGNLVRGARKCRACGAGSYRDIANRNRNKTQPFFDPVSGHTFRILECAQCGHLQIFHFDNDDTTRPEWKDFDRTKS